MTTETNPSDFIIDKDEAFVQLDDINVSLRKLDQLMTSQNKLMASILEELLDKRDEGKAVIKNGTLSTTSFTILDTQILPGHEIKGYTIKNTSSTTDNIFVAHNIANQPQIDTDISDTLKNDPIFNQVLPNESVSYKYNNNCIKSIHILAASGSPTYKLWMVW